VGSAQMSHQEPNIDCTTTASTPAKVDSNRTDMKTLSSSTTSSIATAAATTTTVTATTITTTATTTTMNKNNDKHNNNHPQKKDPILPHRQDPALLESFRYINTMPGKNVRGKMIDCFQLWFKVQVNDGNAIEDDGNNNNNNSNECTTPEAISSSSLSSSTTKAATTTSTTETPSISTIATTSATTNHILNSIKDIVGDLHNASLMIDDIEDNSKLRRGCPVAHSIFGIPTVINGANYAYFLALEKCHALNNRAAMDVFVGELLNLHRGQGHDIMWRDDVHCPTEEEYLEMVQDKTGGLFRLAVGLMQAFATDNHRTDFTPLVNNLALYFQIRDDYINLVDEEYMKSKSFCEDLTEGKFSFPIIHCIRNTPTDHRLLSILKKRTDDVDVKRYAQQLMVSAGSMDYTRDKCIGLKEEIIEQIVALGGNPPLLTLVQALDVQIQNLKTPVLPRTTNIDVA
jgi:geranylgeranyl diphosphate synthase type 3